MSSGHDFRSLWDEDPRDCLLDDFAALMAYALAA
jgi:hypothetical protein